MAIGRLYNLANAGSFPGQTLSGPVGFGGAVAIIDLAMPGGSFDLVVFVPPTANSSGLYVFDGGLPAAPPSGAPAIETERARTFAPAGDVDGDGRADLLLTGLGPFGTNGAILYGDADGFAPGTTLAELVDTGGATLLVPAPPQPPPLLDVRGIGDLDGDGLADLALSFNRLNFFSPPPDFDRILFGAAVSRGPASLDPDAAAGLAFTGARVAGMVALGDLNNDGFDELGLLYDGTSTAPNTPIERLAILFGAADLADFGTIDLTALPAGRVVAIDLGPDQARSYGLGAAGDLNNDGIDDLVVTRRDSVTNQPGSVPLPGGAQRIAGDAVVLYGAVGFGTFGPIRLDPGPAAGFRILPDAALFTTGGSGFTGVAPVAPGDLTGDGIDDLLLVDQLRPLVGAPTERLLLLPGGIDPALLGPDATIDTADPAEPVLLTRLDLPPNFVTAALGTGGDVTGDGVNDLVIGIPGTQVAPGPFAVGPGRVILVTGGAGLLPLAAPTLVDDVGVVGRDGQLVLDVLANDVIPGGAAPGSLRLVGTPSLGSATIENARVVFTPDGDPGAEAVLTYAVDNAAGLSGTGTVRIQILDIPEVLVVTSRADGIDADPATLTLREAVELAVFAEAPRTILLAGGAPYQLDSPLPRITGAVNVTLRGDGAAVTTLLGGGSAGGVMLQVAAGGSLTVADLTLAPGPGFVGSGIENSGALTVTGATLRDFQPEPEPEVSVSERPEPNTGKTITTTTTRLAPADGAAIRSLAGSVEIVASEFLDNAADNGGAIAALGGRVAITDSRFEGNSGLLLGDGGRSSETLEKPASLDIPTKVVPYGIDTNLVNQGAGAAIYGRNSSIEIDGNTIFAGQTMRREISGDASDAPTAVVFVDMTTVTIADSVEFRDNAVDFDVLDPAELRLVGALAAAQTGGTVALATGFDLDALTDPALAAPFLIDAGGVLEATTELIRIELRDFILELRGSGLALDLAGFDPADPRTLTVLAGLIEAVTLRDRATGAVVIEATGLALPATALDTLLDTGIPEGASLFTALALGGLAISGSAAADTLVGGDGADTLAGLDGDDRVRAEAGADAADGALGADALRGRSGGDTLAGGAGDDTLGGQSGADQLDGGDGADLLKGGPGADTLEGGAGPDRLLGGPGPDRFVLRPGEAFGDWLPDFDPVEDVLALVGFDPATVLLEPTPGGYELRLGGLVVGDFGAPAGLTLDPVFGTG